MSKELEVKTMASLGPSATVGQFRSSFSDPTAGLGLLRAAAIE
ncbi:MAG: hypothetical protein ACXVHB_29920 [Solirubrobacteraceae bacterium]